MIGESRSPRIVKISRSQKSLLDYDDSGEYVPYKREHFRGGEIYRQARMMFSDHEIKLLIFWAIIAPLAGVAYLIWVKYENLRLLAIALFAASMVQFVFQWQGMYTLVSRFLTP